jgi:signal peptidase II
VPGRGRREIGRAAFYVAAASTILLDQVTKAFARSFLQPGLPVAVIPGFFSLKLTENPGAAFGSTVLWHPLLVLVGFIAVILILGMRKERSRSKPLAISLGLLMGGAVGNLIDRVLPGHDVTDFLNFGVTVGGRHYTWPTFNLADTALTIGVILLAYHIIFVERKSGEELGTNTRKSN